MMTTTNNNNKKQNAFLSSSSSSSALLSLSLSLSLLLLLTTAILVVPTTTAWTTTTTPMRTSIIASSTSRSRATSSTISSSSSSSSSTALFGKKKKKKDTTVSNSSATKLQVKLLQHIAGTGQAGDVIMVNPIFFDNKLRPQKLARVITDDEVQNDIVSNQENLKQLNIEANTIVHLLGSEESESDSESDSDSENTKYTLSFLDNQTGPDGLKLFGGIGPKKLLDALKLDCNEFDIYSKEHTKLVSIVDVEEQEETVDDTNDANDDKPAFKSWDYDDDNDDDENPSTTFKSLPKSDKLTIKRTGIYRLKVSLTKEIDVMIRVIVE
jgi:ribosomal protein L9